MRPLKVIIKKKNQLKVVRQKTQSLLPMKSLYFRQYKQKAAEESKRKRRLKVDSWEIVNESVDEDDGVPDLRDIEFRLSNDSSRIHSLITGSSASSGRDLVMLKVTVNSLPTAFNIRLLDIGVYIGRRLWLRHAGASMGWY